MCKLKVTVSSGNQSPCKHMPKWDAIFTPLKLAKVILPHSSTQGLSPFPLKTTEGRERNAGYEVGLARQTRACATFCFQVPHFDASTGAGIKRKKTKICLPLCFRRLVFTCAVLPALVCLIYVRLCVTSKNKAFLCWYPCRACAYKGDCFWLHYSCASVCVASETGLFTRL